MPNLAATLKEEIRRLARKEIKVETGKTKKAVAQYRRDIARLKRALAAQEKRMASLAAQGRRRGEQPDADGEPGQKVRFSAKSVQAQRRRLKLSAQQYAKLVGVSPLTIYSWEHGKSRPRKAQLDALVAVRKIGKREAIAKLEELGAKKGRRGRKTRKLARRKPR